MQRTGSIQSATLIHNQPLKGRLQTLVKIQRAPVVRIQRASTGGRGSALGQDSQQEESKQTRCIHDPSPENIVGKQE